MWARRGVEQPLKSGQKRPPESHICFIESNQSFLDSSRQRSQWSWGFQHPPVRPGKRWCDQDHGQSPHTGELTFSCRPHVKIFKVSQLVELKHTDWWWNESVHPRASQTWWHLQFFMSAWHISASKLGNASPGTMYVSVVTPDPGWPLFPEPCGSCGPRPSQPKQSNPPLNKMDIATNAVNTAAS